MAVAIISTLVGSILSAILYRLGGMSEEEKKKYIPWKWLTWMKKPRDAFCSIIVVVWVWINLPFIMKIAPTWKVVLAHVLCFGATWGFLTTYWDGLFGYDNFFMHGLMVGVARIWYAIVLGNVFAYVIWAIQALLCGLLMWVVSEKINWKKIGVRDDYGDECGRGAVMVLSLLPFKLLS